MHDNPPVRLLRSTLESLLERLPGWAIDEDGDRHAGDRSTVREIEVELFRLVDERPVRRTRHAVLDTFPDNPLDCPDGKLPKPCINGDWVCETWEWPTFDLEEDGSFTSTMAYRTYTSPSGEHIQHPEYSLVPACLTRIDDAIRFKTDLMMADLLLRIEETDRRWPYSHVVTLLEGETPIASHDADSLPQAIVGAVLKVLLSGWSGEICRYELVDDLPADPPS